MLNFSLRGTKTKVVVEFLHVVACTNGGGGWDEQPASRAQCTEVRFASLLSGGFTTMAVINPPEKNLANRTSVQMERSYGFPSNFFIRFLD